MFLLIFSSLVSFGFVFICIFIWNICNGKCLTSFHSPWPQWTPHLMPRSHNLIAIPARLDLLIFSYIWSGAFISIHLVRRYIDVGKTSWWHLFFICVCYNCISGRQYILMVNSRQISLWYLLVFCICHICIFVARYPIIVANVGQTSWWHFCQEGKCNNQPKENKRRNHKVSRTQQNRKEKTSVRKKDEIIFLEFCGSDHWNKCM